MIDAVDAEFTALAVAKEELIYPLLDRDGRRAMITRVTTLTDVVEFLLGRLRTSLPNRLPAVAEMLEEFFERLFRADQEIMSKLSTALSADQLRDIDAALTAYLGGGTFSEDEAEGQTQARKRPRRSRTNKHLGD